MALRDTAQGVAWLSSELLSISEPVLMVRLNDLKGLFQSEVFYYLFSDIVPHYSDLCGV